MKIILIIFDSVVKDKMYFQINNMSVVSLKYRYRV
jgi:hypothetical protein